MEEHAIKYTQTYQQFKSELDHELNRAASGFVRIGYLLKQARDTDILKDSPYESVTEFADKEYGLDKSQVSRFMSIHDRFGDPDEPEKLQSQFEGFGVKKLTMMLALPDSVNEELNPSFTASEIQTIKEEVEEEKKITPLEVLAEEKPSETEDLGELEEFLYLLGQQEPETMADLFHEASFTLEPSTRKMMIILAPTGQKMYMLRPANKGRVTFNANWQGVKVTYIRTNEKTEYTPDDIADALSNLEDKAMLKDNTEDGPANSKALWALLYDKAFPEEEEQVAPVQRTAKVSAPKKETKPAKTNAKEAEKVQKVESDPVSDADPELNEDEEPEEAMNPPEEIKAKMDKNTLKGYKAGLTADIHTLERLNRENNWRAMRTKIKCMLQTVERIIDSEG